MSLIQRPLAPAGILGRDSLRKIGEYEDAFTYTNPVQACLEAAQAPFRRLHLRQHFARIGRRFNISSHAPLPIVWAHPSVEGEPIEVTDPPKETRGVHNQLQNVHTGG